MVITVVRTDAEPDAGSCAFSLLVLERDMPGFTRGRELAKLGLHGQDTSELHFEDVFVPDRNVLGEVGGGLGRLMQFLQLERLALASAAVGAAIAIFNSTIAYVDERTAFGKPIADFQNSRFVRADIATEIDVNRAFLDQAILAYNVGDLSAVDAAKLKLSPTERSNRASDRCPQLYGGYGYMMEDPAARVFAGLRVQRIYEVERGHARPHRSRPHRSRHHRAPLSQVSTPALRGDLLHLWALAPNYFDVVVSPP